jgi:hypothetical protein
MWPPRRAMEMLSLTILALLVWTRPGVAQDAGTSGHDEDRWQITLESGDYIWDIRLIRLNGDSLLYRQADTVGAARVAQIRELRLIRKSVVRLGEGGGGAMSALTGSDDEVYDMVTMDFATRLRTIQQVLLVHPPKS